jgi:hypothetical protein
MLLKILGFWVAGVAELGRIAGVAVNQNITVHHFAGRPIVGLFAGNKIRSNRVCYLILTLVYELLSMI